MRVKENNKEKVLIVQVKLIQYFYTVYLRYNKTK